MQKVCQYRSRFIDIFFSIPKILINRLNARNKLIILADMLII